MESLIPISEMAALHGITRQTLIYYDEIDLFKPVKVLDNGYRYYSKNQIPFLREICFLKSIDVKLKDIVEHFRERAPEKEVALLQKQKNIIAKKIERLAKAREAVTWRISLYEEAADMGAVQIGEPFIRPFEERRVLFQEYIKPIGKENLHTTLMLLWKKIFQAEMISASSFGSLFRKEAVLQGDYLNGAGSCIFLPVWSEEFTEAVTIPRAFFACMYKYGMPYDTSDLEKLARWVDANGYEVTGDVVDVCLLDTTFYKEKRNADLCLLEIPVCKKNMEVNGRKAVRR